MAYQLLMLLTLVSTLVTWSHGSTLKSGFGLNYDHVGQILPALEHQFLAIDIHLPTYQSQFDLQDFQVDCTPSTASPHGKYKAQVLPNGEKQECLRRVSASAGLCG